MKRFHLLLAAIALLVLPVCAQDGRVTRVIDGDTVDVLVEGETVRVRLLGVDAPEIRGRSNLAEHFGQESKRYLEQLLDDQPVRLEIDPRADTVDAYERKLRYLFLEDGTLVNQRLIEDGYAYALTRFPFSKTEAFRAAESAARENERGLWKASDVPSVGTAEAASVVGSIAEVCGTVRSTHYARRTRGRPTFLNVDGEYPDQPFTIVIWDKDREALGDPAKQFDQQPVCAYGRVELHRDTPQIVVRAPSQLYSEARFKQ